MQTMMVSTPPPRARTTVGLRTITTPIATTIATTFKIPLHQIHLKMNQPIKSPGEWKKGTTLTVGDSMIAGLTRG